MTSTLPSLPPGHLESEAFAGDLYDLGLMQQPVEHRCRQQLIVCECAGTLPKLHFARGRHRATLIALDHNAEEHACPRLPQPIALRGMAQSAGSPTSSRTPYFRLEAASFCSVTRLRFLLCVFVMGIEKKPADTHAHAGQRCHGHLDTHKRNLGRGTRPHGEDAPYKSVKALAWVVTRLNNPSGRIIA